MYLKEEGDWHLYSGASRADQDPLKVGIFLVEKIWSYGSEILRILFPYKEDMNV